MSDYQPTSRRPIAGMFRRTAEIPVRLCARAGVHPDVVSYLSMVVAAAAGVCLLYSGRLPVLLLIAPLFCYLRLWLNMLDGMVALATGKASWRGEILNDLPDRVSDTVIFVGVAHSGLCLLPLGYWAAILALITAYVGLFGQAVGVQREFSGLMSKPWRMVLLHLGAWAQWGWMLASPEGASWRGLTALDGALIVVLAGCGQTIWVRLARISRALAEKEKRTGSAEP